MDSQGDAGQATSLATKLISDKTVLGVVGPGFSGETEATGPAFSQAGLVTVSPSATDPSLSTTASRPTRRAATAASSTRGSTTPRAR